MSSQDRTSGPGTTYTRRAAIGLGAAALAGAALTGEALSGETAAAAAGTATQPILLDALRPEIAPRSAWGADRPVSDPIVAEEDVRFLLVHHTASTNDYQQADVADQIRAFHRFHTGPEKGWPDVAYNFFVDRFGGIWEARQGSIDGPVRGDATGGSQGFALLCSLIGNHAEAPVTDAARSSMIALLAWLAERHGIETEPGSTVDFVSRGSNRWPAGTAVTAATISGHRDMSQTSCPGDFAYGLIGEELPRAVSERRLQVRAAVSTTSQPAPVDSEPEPSLTASSTTGGDPSTDSEAALGSSSGRDQGLVEADDVVVPAVIVAGAAAAAGVVTVRRRRATSQDS